MKRLTSILLVAIVIMLASCSSNVEKARMAFDEGVRLMYNSSNFKAAEEQFTIAIKYDPDNHEAYYYRGCCKFNRSAYDDAIVDFEKALEVKPDYADAEFNLGRTYFLKNDYDMACFYYKAAQEHGRKNMEDYVKSCN